MTDDPCDEWPVYIKWEGARFDPRCRSSHRQMPVVALSDNIEPPNWSLNHRFRCHKIKALPEADGKCDDCGSYVWFGEGATTAHCYNDDCGRVVRR